MSGTADREKKYKVKNIPIKIAVRQISCQYLSVFLKDVKRESYEIFAHG